MFVCVNSNSVTNVVLQLASLRFPHLFFVIYSAWDALLLEISVIIFKRISWIFQNIHNLQSLDDFEASCENSKVIIKDLLVFGTKLSIKIIFGNFYFLWIAITWLKIIQTSQVGGVLESSGAPLPDGHRDFEDWCILGWVIHEKQVCKS